MDVKPFTILDLPNVENSEKIKDLYIEKGFSLAEVTSDIIEGEDQRVDVIFVLVKNRRLITIQITESALSDQK